VVPQPLVDEDAVARYTEDHLFWADFDPWLLREVPEEDNANNARLAAHLAA
jgi:hypothetical protein